MFQYYGGKGLLRTAIVQAILTNSDEKLDYVEPFVGACNTLLTMKKQVPARRCFGADYDSTLINTLKAVQEDGFLDSLPKEITEEEYTKWRKESKSFYRGQIKSLSPVLYFIGKATGYQGHVYQIRFKVSDKKKKDTNKIYQRGVKKLQKELPFLKQTTIIGCQDYKTTLAQITESKIPCVVYCDPPYKGSCFILYGVKDWRNFDHDEFWKVIREFQIKNPKSKVFVSERTAPDDFISVWSRTMKKPFANKESTEHLFVLGSMNS
jgi:site-specific DNA-adenine methylase